MCITKFQEENYPQSQKCQRILKEQVILSVRHEFCEPKKEANSKVNAQVLFSRSFMYTHRTEYTQSLRKRVFHPWKTRNTSATIWVFMIVATIKFHINSLLMLSVKQCLVWNLSSHLILIQTQVQIHMKKGLKLSVKARSSQMHTYLTKYRNEDNSSDYSQHLTENTEL